MERRMETARLELLNQELQALGLYFESIRDPGEARRVRERMLELEVELQFERERLSRAPTSGSNEQKRERRVSLGHDEARSGSPSVSDGLEVVAELRMPSIPTSIAQMLALSKTPLVQVSVLNNRGVARRVRVATHIEGYSAKAVSTRELRGGGSLQVAQFPPLFAERQATVNELTVAPLHVEVDDLDSSRCLHHETLPVRLLARQTAVLHQLDPVTGSYRDLRPFLAAWITPNARQVLAFLRKAADFSRLRAMQGYQVDASGVREHVRAIYETLKSAEITYINSTGAFGSAEGQFIQRVRLPSESLSTRSANCVDGSVLMASLLEATGIASALVLVPGHAYLGWLSVAPGSEQGVEALEQPERHFEAWDFVETTLIGSASFDDACSHANAASADYHSRDRLAILPVSSLRAQGITPME